MRVPAAGAVIVFLIAISVAGWYGAKRSPCDATTVTQPIAAVARSNVAGIYEQTVIESSPYLIVQGPRTVTVVTRYWGDRPDKAGRVAHGRVGIGHVGNPDRCFDYLGEEGETTYGEKRRGSKVDRLGLPEISLDGAGTIQGPLAAEQERVLATQRGEAVVLPIALSTRVFAWSQLFLLPMLAGAAALALPFLTYDVTLGIKARRNVWRAPAVALAVATALATPALASTAHPIGDAIWMTVLVAIVFGAVRVGPATAATVAGITVIGGLLSGPLLAVVHARRAAMFGAAILAVGLALTGSAPERWLRRTATLLTAVGSALFTATVWNAGSQAGGSNSGLIALTAAVGLILGFVLAVGIDPAAWRPSTPEQNNDR